MATSTTNLGLTKPAGTDKIRIAQINGNMDILDEKIGAVGNTSLQAQITSQNEAIANLNVINVTSSTTIASLCVSCLLGEHRYYGSSVSTTFSDFPSIGTIYYPVIHIFKRLTSVNACDITIIGVTGTNVSKQCNGWYESGNFYWQELALDSNTAKYHGLSNDAVNCSTTAQIESAVANEIALMSNGQTAIIYVSVTASGTALPNSSYRGIVTRGNQNYYSCTFTSYSGDTYIYVYANGTKNWDSYALNSKILKSATISGTTSATTGVLDLGIGSNTHVVSAYAGLYMALPYFASNTWRVAVIDSSSANGIVQAKNTSVTVTYYYYE